MLATLAIRDVERVTPRAKLVRIDLGEVAFEYLAGQAVLLAPEGQTERRPYSIASAPEDVKRSGIIDLLVGTESGHAHWNFDPGPGDRVDVEGPFGSFTFPDAPVERRFLFIAGGTGIAPLRAMLRHALGIPHDRIALFYSARTAAEFAFEEEFRTLADAGAITFHQTVTRDAGAAWTGPRGRLNAELVGPLVGNADTLSFVCGPASMVDDVPRVLEQAGISRERIRIEEWQPRDG